MDIIKKLRNVTDEIRVSSIILGILLIFSLQQQFTLNRRTEQNFDRLTTAILNLESRIICLEGQVDSLNLIHPWRERDSKRSKNVKIMCPSTFLGFQLFGVSSTKCHPDLKEALESFNGPKTGINSLTRKWSRKSDHYHGKAVDMKLTLELCEYLVSEEGQNWLKEHNLKFYIEGKPKSKVIQEYQNDDKFSRYVLFNRRATGDHIHIEFV